jgi:Pirin
MEILTYVLQGSIAHKDSMAHEEVLGPNEIQECRLARVRSSGRQSRTN